MTRSNLFYNSCPVCTAQSWTETPTVGSLPVVGSKTTPREKTNNTVQVQTAPHVCFWIERKGNNWCGPGYLHQRLFKTAGRSSVSYRCESLSTCKTHLRSEEGTSSPEGPTLKVCTHTVSFHSDVSASSLSKDSRTSGRTNVAS